jgi:DNA-binding MarR family transcriptional regulator
MHTHGLTRRTLAGLVRAGFAMAQHDTDDRRFVGRIRITEAGRRVIED